MPKNIETSKRSKNRRHELTRMVDKKTNLNSNEAEP